VNRRAPFNWPTEPTLEMLESMQPELFRQCEAIFGRQRAGQLVFAAVRRSWP
jgi:hypothetical protein